ncbi:uncharacterized protein LOC127708950 isoform X2 [Mytilus californianus]|uniref:uncharacterized protein LOC127708950 isoform X2 n=1 Tax=Mytilus californianus TaxID=6549 RepID=UPI0022482039|nr:uncharacterized protein LOC127708950 isoform X2 [Mytilus californianus]XP_052070122.1 uncharacterized protein LOC127708950 isoform X2 [Mytilus californianus]XP_052070123.1 uncharacterized protein LOC127708950 isoform X2 [Mytilus californianus]XP_052070125.1 uncharacterized protein LOC127708950 isoform X2 [Mytilus californianus]XP_052070126.1 uncharacterized protein LOC127708950 isoform X2 [Mytilus californianus]
MTSELTVMDTSGTDHQLLDDSVRQIQTTTRSKTVRCRQKVKKWLPCVVVFMLICVVALLIAVLIDLPKSDNSTQDSNNGVTSAHSSNKTTKHKEDNYCIHHTRSEFLESLPDDIDHLCKPQKVVGATKMNWFACPNTHNFTDMFIPPFCLCDTHSQCKHHTKDLYRKQNCTLCRDKMHCPCQNNGKCETCPDRFVATELNCHCSSGTEGKYCTKINKRICHLVVESDIPSSYDMCNSSNNNTCLVTYGENTFKCTLSDSSELHVDCSLFDRKHAQYDLMVEAEKQGDKKSSGENQLKSLIIICISLIAIAICILLYVNISLCRKESSGQFDIS